MVVVVTTLCNFGLKAAGVININDGDANSKRCVSSAGNDFPTSPTHLHNICLEVTRVNR